MRSPPPVQSEWVSPQPDSPTPQVDPMTNVSPTGRVVEAVSVIYTRHIVSVYRGLPYRQP